MPAPCQLVGHVHDDRADGRDPGRVAGRRDVPGGPERDRKNLSGSDQPPRDGLRNRSCELGCSPRFSHWPESGRPSRVVRCAVLGRDRGEHRRFGGHVAEFRRGPSSYARSC